MVVKIMVFLSDGFEETECVAVVDLLKRAGIEVSFISTLNREVKGNHNITLVSDKMIWEIDPINEFDGIFLPGGQPGVSNLLNQDIVINTVREFYRAGKYVCAICAAPLILEKAGLLGNKKFTCFPSVKKEIKSGGYQEEKVVADGNLITGKAMGVAIDMGLKMVEVFQGKEEALRLGKAIIYSN